ncbi:MAG: preprotein translocase subunit SecE [Candidatus Latescibacteria bacterium]|nr:preprotein translocase subunit SecE [Candidatus Latescibacterota bacterium]
MEIGKVSWPAKKELFASTWVVLLFSVIFALGVWVVDLLFSRVLRIVLG